MKPPLPDPHRSRPGPPAEPSRVEELSLLLELSRTLAADLELPQIYRQVVEAVSRTFGYAMVSVYTVESGFLRLQHQVGYVTWVERVPLGEGTMSRAVQSGRPVFIPEASLEPDFIYAVPGITSMVAVPVYAQGKVCGVLCVESLDLALTEEDCRLLQAVAFQVGGAVGRGLLVASLLDQERLYRTLVETMPAAVVLYDGDEYVYANPRALQTLGLASPEELKRRRFSAFSQPGAPLPSERYARVLRGEAIERAEDQLRNLRGEVVDLEVSAHPVELGGRTLGLVAWQDITERKRAEAALRESAEHYRHRVELSPQVPWTADPEGNITDVNRRWTTLTGMGREETLGDGWARAAHLDDLPPSLEAWSRSLRTGEPLSLEHRFRMADGSYRWMHSRAYPRRDERGQIVRWYGTTEDIHARKGVEATLRRSEGLHRTLVQFSREVVEILDREGNLLYVSANVAALGFDPEFWKTHQVNIFDYVQPEYRAKAHKLLAEVLRGSGTAGPLLMPLRPPGAQENLWFEVLLENRLDDPDLAGIVLRARDVTEQRSYEATIRHMAYHDALTGLPNRRLFAEQGQSALGEARAAGQPCALLYLDLDQFKGVNDSLGHQAGDELLVGVAERLRGCLREGDLLARLGGDEMAILLPRTDRAGAQGVAARVRSALAEPFRLGGLQVVTTASIGIALSPQHGTGLDALMQASDAAMYTAKEGRDRWAVYQPALGSHSRERLELLQDLRQALKDDALSLVYQPILPLRPGLRPKAEALLRWSHPARGPVSPGEFIPLAEAHGLAPALDTWVFKRAVREMPPEPFELCVNISALTLLDPQPFERIRRAVGEGRLDPAHLWLEVTETALMRDFETSRRNLEAVRRLGIRIALDDFGVGQTSLAHLSRLPVDTLKIDRSFTAGVGTPEGEALLGGILALAQGLGLATVAEGVETAGQLAWLAAGGCDYAQGYFLGRPTAPAAGDPRTA